MLTLEEKRAFALEVGRVIESDDYLIEGLTAAPAVFPLLAISKDDSPEWKYLKQLVGYAVSLGVAHGRGVSMADLQVTDEEREELGGDLVVRREGGA